MKELCNRIKQFPRKMDIVKEFFDNYAFENNAKVLDVGGISSYYILLKQIFRNSDIILLNINRSNIMGVNSIVGDATLLPLKNESLNVITSFDVLEHLINCDDFLMESFRVLKSGGWLVISTPNLADIYSRITFSLGYTPFSYNPSKFRVATPFSKIETNMGHKSVFTYKGLKKLLEIHRFNIISSYGYSYTDSFYFETDSEKKNREVGFYEIRKSINNILPKSMREGMLFICNKKEC
jgi:ubiquinone/menaquinone biosynthesis C-methylase UbiE